MKYSHLLYTGGSLKVGRDSYYYELVEICKNGTKTMHLLVRAVRQQEPG